MKLPYNFASVRFLTVAAQCWGLVGMAAWLLSAQTPVARFAATTDNVAGAGDAIRIDITRWSTEAERDALLRAWSLTPAPGGGRGRGVVAAGPTAAPVDEFQDGNSPAPAAAKGKGAGKGKAKGGDAAAAPRITAEASLAAALGKAPIVGHLWSSEVAGYGLRYALKFTEPDGGERIILISDRRLGGFNDLWKPNAGTPANYEFSVIELRVNAKGEGEGKASLTGKVTVDSAAKTLALENAGSLPVIFKALKRRT
jgi:hypothetical protein